MGFKERHPEVWSGLLDRAQELPPGNFPWRIRQMVLRGEEPVQNQVNACYSRLATAAKPKKKRPPHHAAGAAPDLLPIEHMMGKELRELKFDAYRFVWVDGTILVRAAGEFVGKIRAGKFIPAPLCTTDNARDIRRLAKHPGG